jgi:serine/threonine protein kinase
MTTPNDPIYKYQPLFGSWNIEEEIGEGSFGIVYRVSKEQLGQKYISAVKLISIPSKEQFREAKNSLGTDASTLHAYFQDIVENIIKEVNILHSLSGNSNILTYHDHTVIEREDKIGWDILIRMECVTSLPKYLETNSLSREQVIRLGIEICSALEMCSKKGIIHRDIKDENIFVNEDEVFKLGDFGIARELSGSGRAASMRGTPLYMAPEVYRGEKYDAAVDIYSLGIVLYKLLNNGRMPFMPSYPDVIKYKDSEEALDRRMSGEALLLPVNGGENLCKAILKACAYNPADRYSSAKEMKIALVQVLAELGPQERDEKVRMPFMRPEPEQQSKIPAEQSKGTFSKYDGLQGSVTDSADLHKDSVQINQTMSIFNGIEGAEVDQIDKITQESLFEVASISNQPSNLGTAAVSDIKADEKMDSSSENISAKTENQSSKERAKKKTILIGILVGVALVSLVVYISSNRTKLPEGSQKPTSVEATPKTTAGTTDETNVTTSTNTSPQMNERTQLNSDGADDITVVGDWVYYSNYNDNYYIYKIRTDGTERTQVNSDWADDITVVGDWVYYSNYNDNYYIYKIRTDGTERTQVNSETSESITVIGDWVYYVNYTGNFWRYICKIRTDGTKRTQLSSDYTYIYSVFGDWVYYWNSSENGNIYKIRTDGTERTQVNSAGSGDISVVGDWVYYVNSDDNRYIYKIRTDGTERTQVTSDWSESIDVVGDWVYYSNGFDSDKIYKIRTDGTGKTLLTSDSPAGSICVVDGWVYYANEDDNNYIYKIRTDGTA